MSFSEIIDSQIDRPSEEENVDSWRILLVNLAYLMSSYFMDVRYWEGIEKEKNTFSHIVETLHELDQMAGHDGTILIRYRGLPGGSGTQEKVDYVMEFGKVVVDSITVPGMVKRLGIQMTHLSGRVVKAFETFSKFGISNLYLKIPGESAEAIEHIRVCLSIISRYNQALKVDAPIVFNYKGEEISLSPILDQRNQPDPNLTVMAGLNALSTKVMQALVRKMDLLMRRSGSMKSGEQYSSVYNAIFGIEKLKEKLVRPPIEINNLQWMMVDGDQAVALRGKADPGQSAGGQQDVPKSNHEYGINKIESIEKRLDLFVDCFMDLESSDGETQKKFDMGSFEKQNSTDEKLNQVIDYLVAIEPSGNVDEALKKGYGGSFEQIDSHELAERLRLATKLVSTIEKTPGSQQVLQGVMNNFKVNLGQVPDNVYDDLLLAGDELRVRSGEKEMSIDKVPASISELIGFYKKRADARKKMMSMVHHTIHFEVQDYEAIARDFDISIQDSKDIISLVKGCFDSRGHFLRDAFEKNIPEFARYEEKIFEFLWNYLKETHGRNDRVSLLNSLQFLIVRIEQPKKAFKVLLTDFCFDPSDVRFSDRNAMMLANLLVRNYNKESNINIEITPEEVLLVKNGLNLDIAVSASQMIVSYEKRWLEKIKTIHKWLLEALDLKSSYTQPVSARFLLALEREIGILISLVGGGTALIVIRNALKEYGNPGSKIYMLRDSPQHMTAILQNLKVLIRGMERIGEKEDLFILDKVKGSEDRFMSLGKGPRHEAVVRRIIKWVDKSINNCSGR